MTDLPPRAAALAEALAAELALHVVDQAREQLLRAAGAPEPWLTPDQVAKLANVGVSTALEWIRSGKLRHGRASGKVVRVRASDLDAFLRAGAEQESTEARKLAEKMLAWTHVDPSVPVLGLARALIDALDEIDALRATEASLRSHIELQKRKHAAALAAAEAKVHRE